jgi:MinD-like ATPase involved in chromosome partitioning or flagellar assembly
MAQIIAIHSFRRGLGKSNLAANLALLIAAQKRRVGLVDMDLHTPSQHILFGLKDSDIRFTLNDFLWGNAEIEQTVMLGPIKLDQSARPISLVPASTRPADIARVLRGDYYVHLIHDGFDRLIDTCDLDVVLIDAHAGLSEETLLAFGVADTTTIILGHDQRDFQGTAVTIDVVRKLEIPRVNIIVNQLSPTLNPGQVRQEVAGTYGCEVLGVLPHSEELAELASRTLFIERYPQHAFTRELEHIAAKLIG